MPKVAVLDLRTEEDVKIKFLLPFLRRLGYKDSCFSFNEGIEVQEGRKQKTIFPDVVVYASPQKTAPLVLCETKAPTEILDKFAKEQAISYARLLPRIAPIALITNGAQVQVFQTLGKNRIAELPHRETLQADIVNFIVSRDVQDTLRAEAKHELFIIDDVKTFKNVLKRCHNEIRNNEGYDPTVAFDEMSKVLFCKLYEEKEQAGNNRFRLSVFDDTLERLSINVVRQIFDETKRNDRYAGLFDVNTAINLNDRTIRTIVSLFENYDLSLTAFDVKGEAFEYFLSDTFTGGLGEFFTPRNVVEFIVDAINPKIGDRIVDPFCGTGGFLIYAFEVVGEKIRLQDFSNEEKEKWRIELSNRSLYGTDWKERTSQACKMNMMVHGDGSAGIFMHHGLTDVADFVEVDTFTICVTNPPFGSHENDPVILASYELGGGRKSQDRVVLAIERAIRLVKPGGLIGIVVIDGILNNRSMRYVREYIRKNAWILGIVSLGPATFEGYGARAKTSVLFLQKKVAADEGKQESVFMAIAQNTGYAPSGAQIPGNELPDILIEYQGFLRDGPNCKRELSWVALPKDRLDAEYYQPRDSPESEDVPQLREEVSGLLTQVAGDYASLLSALDLALVEQDFVTVRLDELLEETSVKERLVPDVTYRQLGVRWWGGGTFVREENLGSEIKATSLFRVSAGWVIYNRLFAFRGSFAIVEPDHEGCHASGEFPTFRVKDQVTSPVNMAKYVVYCLNSPQYLAIVDKESTGSTKQSRNRFNQRQFLDLSIKIPRKDDALAILVAVQEKATELHRKQDEVQQQIGRLERGISMMVPIPSDQAE